MDTHLQQAETYIKQQLMSGQAPDTVLQQLRNAGWQETLVQQAFQNVQQQMVPTSMQSPATSQPTTDASASKPQVTMERRGRIRNGWRLFTASLSILKGNRYLLRYLIMTGVMVFAYVLLSVGVYLLISLVGHRDLSDDNGDPIGVLGYVLAFLDYLFVYFIINYYAAGLTANMLDIFHGNKKPYHDYMQQARSRVSAIFVFSLISATVGFILQYVVERIRFVGWILAWLLGTAWSLGTLFGVPIIMTDDQPNGTRAIKKSFKFFKDNWGEGLITKGSVNIPLFFINLAIIVVFMTLLLIAIVNSIIWLAVIIFFMYLIILLITAIIGSFANSLVNIALFYYATYQQVPPAFTEDMLNHVFIKRKRRFLKDKSAGTATA